MRKTMTAESSSKSDKPQKKIRVQIDVLNDPVTGGPMWFPARTSGARWNGFATPWFNKETADRLMSAFNAQRAARDDHGVVARYEAAEDAYVFIDDEIDGDPEIFQGHDFNGEVLYPIGAWSWSWSAERDFE